MENELENQEAVEGQEQEVTTSEAGSGTPQMIPKERFDQVYQWQKELKEFGASPAEIRQQLKTFSEWKQKVEDYNNQQSLTPDEKTEAQRQQAILKELYKVMPGLQKLNEFDEIKQKLTQYEEKATNAEISTNAKRASAAFGETLKSAKIDTKYQDDIEVWIWNKMSEDQQNLIRQGDATEAIKMFGELNKSGMFNGMKAQNIPKPPLRNAPGGTPPKGQAPKGKSFDEATNAAWDAFSGAE